MPRDDMRTIKLAYRFSDSPNDIQGFIGQGFSTSNAISDAVSRIKATIAEDFDVRQAYLMPTGPYDSKKLILNPFVLDGKDLELVKGDWQKLEAE